jgi:23S rRNA (adenine2030-N6)-methyltransferase
LNYRHAYHAGNFADVHKHVVLLALLEQQHKKPAPFFVIDTHAGRGSYDLQSAEAQRGDEWRQGIGRLSQATLTNPVLRRFQALAGANAKMYSGSPLIVAAMLREGDRAVFVEQHPEEANALRRALGKRKHVSVLEGDGYAVLKAQLPPKENRGVVLIDPPYEKDTEYTDVARALQIAHARWPNGVYCLWYPIKPGAAELRLQRSVVDAGIKKILAVTLSIRPADSPLGLNGSGLLIINPPWQLDEQLRAALPELHRILAVDGQGGTKVQWLTGD